MEKSEKSTDFSYKIIPRLFTPSISPGNTIEIWIFVSGTNNDQKRSINGKIFFSYSSHYLINPEDPGQIIVNYLGTEPPISSDLNSYGAVNIVAEKTIFLNNPEAPQQGIAKSIIGESVLGKNERPPMECKINTSSKAPSGNYDVDFVLTYSDGNVIKTDSAKVTVHVKTWPDRNAKALQILAGILAGIGLIATFII